MDAIKGGIELTGTLYTSAQGEAKDKLAMAAQIYDESLGKFQSEINAETANRAAVDEKIAEAVKENVTDRLGANEGIATLGADGKLDASQMPRLKSINGQSIVGNGDIRIDMSLYKVVSELPTENIDENKIYLVPNPQGDKNGNMYTEYIFAHDGAAVGGNAAWEKIGEFKADVDLSGYVQTSDLQDGLVQGIEVRHEASSVRLDVTYNNAVGTASNGDSVSIPAATEMTAGVMSSTDKSKLTAIAEGATADSALTEDELNAILV